MPSAGTRSASVPEQGLGRAILGWIMIVAGAGFVVVGLAVGVWRGADGVTGPFLYAVARLLAGGGLLMYFGRRLIRRRPRRGVSR